MKWELDIKTGHCKIGDPVILEIIAGTDRSPFLPVRIKYENNYYAIHISFMKAVLIFRNYKDEDQVYEKLIELIN